MFAIPTQGATTAALRLILAAGLPLSLCAPAAAQTDSPRGRMLVTTGWLADHLQDADLVVLHVGEKPEYDAGHIPGARYITLRDIDGRTSPEGLPLELPAIDDLIGRLARFGISDDSRIVVYYGNDWVSPSTRVIFTLDYAGLGDRAVLLDGGMQAWKREGRPLTTDVPAPRTGSLSARTPKDLVVDLEWMRTHLRAPGYVIVDARDGAFYDGVQEGSPGRKGHIPGAVSIPFTEVTDDELRLRSPTELEALFTRAGLKRSDTLVLYCHIGQQATAVVFAARSLGYAVKLYDGSFREWGSHADLPVELPGKDLPHDIDA